MKIKVSFWQKGLFALIGLSILFVLLRYSFNIIIFMLIAGLISFLIHPLVNFIKRYTKSRLWAILLTWVGIFLAFFVVGSFLLGPFINQAKSFVGDLPSYAESLREVVKNNTILSFFIDPDRLSTNLISLARAQSERILSLIASFFWIVSSLIFIFVISIYISLNEEKVNLFFYHIAERNGAESVYRAFRKRIKRELYNYFFGQLLTMVIVGVMFAIGTWIIGLPNPLVLGFIAGITEAIPYFGPILGALPAALTALAISPETFYLAIVVYIVVQVIESNILAPIVVGKKTRINPFIILIGIAIGAEIAGFVGILLATPIIVIIKSAVTFVRSHFDYIKDENGETYIVSKRRSTI